MRRKWYVGGAMALLLVVALLFAQGCNGCAGPEVSQQALAGDVSNFSGLHVAVPTAVATATPGLMVDSSGVSNIFEVRDAATPVFAINDGGAVVQTGDLALTGDVALTGGLDLSGLLQTSFADLTVSDGDTITPTVTTYALDTSGAVTVTLAASADEGQLLILINDDANAVIIADTNLRSSDGNAITLTAANDIAVFIYQDAEWNELLLITNS